MTETIQLETILKLNKRCDTNMARELRIVSDLITPISLHYYKTLRLAKL
jgi:hypothetical protein